LSGQAVSKIIKFHFGNEYSGHRARHGLMTALAEKGTPMHVIKNTVVINPPIWRFVILMKAVDLKTLPLLY
jgi:hypothetical protein